MGRFGDTLKTCIKTSGIKYACLAQRINFDSSYISKWINTDLLPSARIITNICEDITYLILERTSENDLSILFKELELKYSKDNKILFQTFYNKIYEDYLFDLNGKSNKDKSNIEITNSFSSQSTEQDRYNIIKRISKYRKISNSITISIIGDLPCCSPQDIIFIMDIKSEILANDFENVNFRIFISEHSITNCNKELTGVTLINLFMIPFKWEISYYTVKILNSGIVINIDNLLSYTAQLFYNNTWMLANFNYNLEDINNFSKTIENIILPISRNLFDTYDYDSLNYRESMLKIFSMRQTGVLAGTIDTFFLHDELLEHILSMYDDVDCNIKLSWLKKHKINQDRMIKGDEINYILYRNALDLLVYKGCMRLFDREIYLPTELRLQVLESISKNLSDFPNLKIKIVDSFLVDEIKHKPLPNVYISPANAYFLTAPIDGLSRYCYLNNKKYISFLNNTFYNLWSEYSTPLLSGKDVINEYLLICQELLFFELV